MRDVSAIQTDPGTPRAKERQARRRHWGWLKPAGTILGILAVPGAFAAFVLDRAERPAAAVDARVDRLESKTDAQVQVIREELRDLYRATLTRQPQPALELPPKPVQPVATQVP